MDEESTVVEGFAMASYPETEVENKLIQMVSKSYGKVPAYQRSFIDIHKNDSYFREVFEAISFDLKMLDRSIRGPLLDVGSGCGTFLWVCRRNGFEAYGVDPDPDKIEIAKTIGLGGFVVRGVAEHLPFKDEAFDLVTSMSVIEHVREPAKVIGESLRVTSRDGAIHMSGPDYSHCFREGHFGVFWLPLLPKIIAKRYLKLRRRPNADYVSSIQYVTGRSIRRMVGEYGGSVEDLRRMRVAYLNQTRTQWLSKKVEKQELIKTRAIRETLRFLTTAGFSKEWIVEVCCLLYPLLCRVRVLWPSDSLRYLIEKRPDKD